jgi:hypothetical protein
MVPLEQTKEKEEKPLKPLPPVKQLLVTKSTPNLDAPKISVNLLKPSQEIVTPKELPTLKVVKSKKL